MATEKREKRDILPLDKLPLDKLPLDKETLKQEFDLSHFDINSVIRGAQLTLVGGKLSKTAGDMLFWNRLADCKKLTERSRIRPSSPPITTDKPALLS